MLIVVKRPCVSSLTISSGAGTMRVRKRKLRKKKVGKSNLKSYKEEKSRIVSNKKPYVTYL